MTQSIPLSALPNQEVTVTLADQVCKIHVYQKGNNPPLIGLFLDLYVNDALIIAGVLCENENRIVRSEYLGFSGDLSFHDRRNDDPQNPYYTELGPAGRFVLLYIPADELDGAA